MEWFRTHPYTTILAIAAILIVGGVIFVEGRSPVSPVSSDTAWGGGAPDTIDQNTYTYGQPPNPQQIAQQVVQGGQGENVTIPTLVASTSSKTSSPSGPFDYTQLLAELSAQGSVKGSASTNAGQSIIQEAYQFIPQGLVATIAPTAKAKTPAQQALYDYGNEVGGEIQSFEELNSNQAEILKDQAEDRTDPEKAAAVVRLGQALATVGTFMQQMQEVPPSAQSLHDALAKSYLDIGAKLQVVANAQSDTAFVQAVQQYDTSANTFVQNYAALAQFFSAQGIVFSQQDQGSVFSFNQGGGGL